MDAEDAKKAQLVEAVVDIDCVRAAGLIDVRGNLRRIHGHAKVFRNGAPLEADGGQASEEDFEDIYLEPVGDEYLVVVFGVGEDFEPIKEEVDTLFEKLDL
ncbi:MAG: hypothetical protein ABEN55_15150 [Bradymonadaceae bacterium]